MAAEVSSIPFLFTEGIVAGSLVAGGLYFTALYTEGSLCGLLHG